jgi:hypothetical protein
METGSDSHEPVLIFNCQRTKGIEMTHEELLDQAKQIKTFRDNFNNPGGEEIEKWCETTIKLGKKLINERDVGETKAFIKFKDLYENGMVITIDLNKLAEHFDGFYDKIRDRTMGAEEAVTRKREKNNEFNGRRKY